MIYILPKKKGVLIYMVIVGTINRAAFITESTIVTELMKNIWKV